MSSLSTTTFANNLTTNRVCKDGLLVGALEPSIWASMLYLAGLLYCFLGIAIGADLFMCAIERITSVTRKVKISGNTTDAENVHADDLSDVVTYKEVAIWNPTVANLTLMALGSSAPEILLSIIEIVGNGFYSGELGPSTIVGSAAFNLLCITAVCVMTIPSPGVSRIEQIMVFITTSAFSVFAYIWLLIILVFISPNQVEVWEGALTLIFMVVLCVAAYLADIRICDRFRTKREEPTEMETHPEKEALHHGNIPHITPIHGKLIDEQKFHFYDSDHMPLPASLREVERQVALEYPNLSPEDHAKMIAWRLKQAEMHDRLWYRIQASRWLSSSKKKEEWWNAAARTEKPLPTSASVNALPGSPTKRQIEFAARAYSIESGDRRIRLKVIRRGRNHKQVVFRYVTVNGVAKKNTHFLPKSETLRFEPGESEKELSIELMDGVEWKSRDAFYVHLELVDDESKTELGMCKVAEIIYPDQSLGVMPGVSTVEFVKNHLAVEENRGRARLYVTRRGRLTPRLKITYETQDVTAEDGKDYHGGVGELSFQENEIEKYIDIPIIDDMDEEKDETFNVFLTSSSDGVILGHIKHAVVTIISDDGAMRYFRQMDRLVPKMLDALTPGKKTWIDQIIAATSVNAGDIEDATFGDCITHMISFPWKVLFAFVPPPIFLSGWLTFIVTLALIGVITAVVGDLASIFGCMVGLKDSITAITFVAMGTSLPDTFASRFAAMQDKTADNAIGNVTGSNSVNVFLGLGLPWFVAAVYWASKGEPFMVQAGSLGFSVTVYTIMSLFCLGLLFARRKMALFGQAELGGPQVPKILSAVFMVTLWILYVLLSSLQAYGYINV